MATVSLVPFEPGRHMPLVAEWLRQPHVARWWGDADTTLAEMAAHPVATEAIIELEGQAVGCVVWQTPTRAEMAEAGLDDLPADLVDIDIMIGVAERLGSGVGPEALLQLLARLKGEDVATVGLGTATANQRALRAYAKAGFHPYRDFQEDGQDMRYFIRNLASVGAPQTSGP